MPITIEDISRRLGVSKSTVSRALNDSSEVSDATRERVLAVVREVGYQPTTAARNLRRRSTEKIGFVLSSTATSIGDYFSEIILGATTVAEENNHNIVLYTNEGDSPTGLLNLFQKREVDGLILVWNHVPSAVIDPLLYEGLPFVVLGRRVNHPQASYIAPDNYRGARVLMSHLLDLGHRRIGFTTHESLKLTNVDRLAGYRDALKLAGIPYEPDLVVETGIGLRDDYVVTAQTNQLLELPDPPSAIFAFHDLIAIEVLRAIQARGLGVPQDIALAGFDGLKGSLLTTPAITTVKQPLAEIGAQSVQALLSLIENPDRPPIQITLPVELDIRASTQGNHV